MVRGDRRGRLLRSETPAMAGPSCPEGWAARLSHGHHRDYLAGMSLPPDQPPSPKPKVSAEERRARQDDRLKCIRLRMAIGKELEERGITTPAAIGEVLGMSAPEAIKLLARHRWHEGDVASLKAAAARLGLRVPGVE